MFKFSNLASTFPKHPNSWRNTQKSGFFHIDKKNVHEKNEKNFKVFEIKKWSQTS